MTEIAHIVRNVFTGMSQEEKGDIQIGGQGREFALIGNSKRAIFQLNQANFGDMDEGLIDEFERARKSAAIDIKNKCIEALSAHETFSQLARLPKTHTISYPGLIVPGLEGVPLEALLRMDIMIIEQQFDYPVFVKPNDGSAGLMACSVHNREALLIALQSIFKNTESNQALIQEKIEIDREYRCVYFNKRAYLLFDRMFKERGIKNGRASQARNNKIAPRHIDDEDTWQLAENSVHIIGEVFDVEYFAADFATDTQGRNWFIETNGAPSLAFAHQGRGAQQMTEMARDMIAYIRD